MLTRILFSFFVTGTLFFSACRGEKSQPEAGDSEVHSAQQGFSGQSMLTAQNLRRASLGGEINVVRQAVKQGVDVNGADEAGRTALMLASYNGHTEVVQYLLEQEARIGEQDAEGRTPLLFAASGPFSETVELLLKWKADPNITDQAEGWTALMFAASEGHLEVVQTLLNRGADVSLKDKDGEKAVDFARNNNHVAVVNLLEGVQNRK